MSAEPEQLVDPEALRAQVREKYRAVASAPGATYHLHTGRPLAERLGYDGAFVDALPDPAVESFAGVGNPFSLRRLLSGEHVLDVGSGAGFDSFVAAAQVGADGQVVGVDMTAEMLAKSRSTSAALGLANVEFRSGLPRRCRSTTDGPMPSSPTVSSTSAPTSRRFSRRSGGCCGGVLQFADIANGQPVPLEAKQDIDLWTG
jgi:arsenite methyltransferase